MPLLALEMEEEEEAETESLMREVNGASGTRSLNGSVHSRSSAAFTNTSSSILHAAGNNSNLNNNKPSSSRRALFLFGLAAIVGISVLFALRDSAETEKPNEVQEVEIKPNTHTSKNNNNNDNDLQPSPSQPARDQDPKAKKTTVPATAPSASDSDNSNVVDFVYSKISTIVPDPDHPITDSMKKKYDDTFGKWQFWDGDESTRPKTDYLRGYPWRDIPGDEFPDAAWQTDAVFVNHYLNDAEKLISRAKEAIYAEYGKPKANLDAKGLAQRTKMFHLDKLQELGTGPPPAYTKRGDRGNGGWTTQRSFDGLVKRLLHAMMTSDTFTVVLAGHSAAAGHGGHFRQSYVQQFHKIMSPVFARLGVKLITRNLSQGGLGTIQNALGSGDLYGNEVDLLLWDSGMTEQNSAHIDLFCRQAILAGRRVPVIWGPRFDILKPLHDEADVDVGEYGNGGSGVPYTDDYADAKEMPYAVRYMRCHSDKQDLCDAEPVFCAKCWIDRPDVNRSIFKHIADRPGGQVKWHPGWRRHQLQGRVLAMNMLDALQTAIQIFSDGTMGGPPLDDEWWHVKGYYENIKSKLVQNLRDKGPCYEISTHLPSRICHTPLRARSVYTPRANPHETSLTNVIVANPKTGYKPTNTQTVMYDGPDATNSCYDLPEDAVDVLAIVSNRRRRRRNGRKMQSFSYENSHGVNGSDQQRSSTFEKNDTFSIGNVQLQRHLAKTDNAIAQGNGWQMVDEPPGDCNGEYDAICGRSFGDPCPTLGHHDSRGMVVGNEWAGWLVMELPEVTEGIIILKLITNLDSSRNSRTKDWTTVNNEGSGRDRQLTEMKNLPDEFQFDYAIDGTITSLSKAEFIEKVKLPQRVVEVITVLDDPGFTAKPKTVQVAFRMRNCGNKCTFGISHVYWA